MAIFRLETKIIGRRAKDKAGKPIPGKSVSVVAKAAYRAGEKLHDERQDKTYNYASRAQEVLHAEIVVPANCPAWLMPPPEQGDSYSQRERLWNAVEEVERRVDSQLAREFVIALPVELDREQQVGLLRDWCSDQVASQGFFADFALHRSHDGNNPHGHVLCTLRPIEGDGFGKKPDMSGKFHGQGAVGLGAKSELEGWRLSWETLCNAALERAGVDARIDHRSLAEQGIDREPEPKIGVEAVGMQRRGAEEDPDRVRDARQVRMNNEMRTTVRAVEEGGEAAMLGETEASWGTRLRSAFSWLASEAREFVRDESSGPRPERDTGLNEVPPGREADSKPGSLPAPPAVPESACVPQPVSPRADLEPER